MWSIPKAFQPGASRLHGPEPSRSVPRRHHAAHLPPALGILLEQRPCSYARFNSFIAVLRWSLGADVVIDHKKDDFETLLSGYDVVLNSQDPKTLEKSLRILKPGGKLISISGPPDAAFAKEIGAPGMWNCSCVY